MNINIQETRNKLNELSIILNKMLKKEVNYIDKNNKTNLNSEEIEELILLEKELKNILKEENEEENEEENGEENVMTVIEKIYKEYEFEEFIIDNMIKNDVRAAIEEAYMIGAVHGAMKNDIFLYACNFVKKHAGNISIDIVKTKPE